MARVVPPGWVRLTCDDPAADLPMLLGSEPPRLTGGFGGWEITARPQQTGMTTWRARSPSSSRCR